VIAPDALRSAAVTLRRAFVAGEVSVVVSFVGVWRPDFLSWWSLVLWRGGGVVL
jgi:hypothetical protein